MGERFNPWGVDGKTDLHVQAVPADLMLLRVATKSAQITPWSKGVNRKVSEHCV